MAADISISTSIGAGSTTGTITVSGGKAKGAGVFDVDLDTSNTGDDDQTVTFTRGMTPTAIATAIENSWSNPDSSISRVGAVLTITCSGAYTITQLDVGAAELTTINTGAAFAAPAAPASPSSTPAAAGDYTVAVTQPEAKPALVATTKAENGGGFYITGEGAGDV